MPVNIKTIWFNFFFNYDYKQSVKDIEIVGVNMKLNGHEQHPEPNGNFHCAEL